MFVSMNTMGNINRERWILSAFGLLLMARILISVAGNILDDI